MSDQATAAKPATPLFPHARVEQAASDDAREFPYEADCAEGKAKADSLAQFLMSNPGWCGTNVLRHMADGMDSARRGVRVGFFARLEQLVRAGAIAERRGY